VHHSWRRIQPRWIWEGKKKPIPVLVLLFKINLFISYKKRFGPYAAPSTISKTIARELRKGKAGDKGKHPKEYVKYANNNGVYVRTEAEGRSPGGTGVPLLQQDEKIPRGTHSVLAHPDRIGFI